MPREGESLNFSFLTALISLVASADLLAYPQLSGQDLQAQVEGDVRHAARVALGKAGFLVDLLWGESSIQSSLHLAVRNEIAQAQAQRAAGGAISAPAVPEPSPGNTTASAGADATPAGGIAALPQVAFIDPPGRWTQDVQRIALA